MGWIAILKMEINYEAHFINRNKEEYYIVIKRIICQEVIEPMNF